MQTPMVSVCLPVYNGDRFLNEAVRSVLEQTYTDFELLIFDDGSTDQSWPILEAIPDPRISLHRNAQNLGPEGNWNQALAAAKGKYIKIFHQDDRLDPTCLERQVESMERNPSSVLSFCRREIIRADGTRFMSRGGPWTDGEVQSRDILRTCVVAGTNLVGEPSAVLFRADVAKCVGTFDGSIPYLIDLDYWARLMVHGPGYYIDTPLMSFRVSSKQWSAVIGRRQSQEFIQFVERMEENGLCRYGWLTRKWGGVMARANGLLRLLIYRFIAGGQ